MKNYKILAAAAAVLLAVACNSDKASIAFKAPDAPESQLVLKQLNGTATEILDTVKTDASGHFSYSVKVMEGNPEFVYIYKGEKRLASLLLEKGERVEVEADTLGNFEVSGSAGSSLLKEGDDNYRRFVARLISLSDTGAEPSEVAREYIAHYRECTKFILTNSKSLAIIPVLYENVGGNAPTFGAVNDALIFRTACDSLKTVYPESKYVKALETETVRREQLFSLQNRINAAGERSFPNLNMPSVNGAAADIDELEAKVTLVYFWDAREATHKIYNLDVLKPVYEKYHSRGFEIYAVCVDPDKAEWAQVVKAQELPWVNVNDGLGTASSSLYVYNVQRVPAFLLVSDEGIKPVANEKELRRELDRQLK